MRSIGVILVLAAAVPPAHAADRIFRHSFENPVDCIATPTNPECPTFTIASPTITVAPGVAASTCFYFTAPNTATRGITRIQSNITGNAWYVVVGATYASGTNTPAARHPPGTVTQGDCSVDSGNTNGTDSYRIYQAHANEQALEMPANDGTGTPVAIEWQAGQPLFLEIVAPNATAEPIQAQVTLGIDALPAGAPYTRTEMLLTYNSQIVIPPTSGASASAACPVPAGVKFWHFTTHTHQRASSATLQAFPSFDTFVVTTNPASPLIQEFGPPFYTFTGGDQLRYSCNYFNPEAFTILSGADEFNDENCVGIGYFFPATRPRICLNNTLIP